MFIVVAKLWTGWLCFATSQQNIASVQKLWWSKDFNFCKTQGCWLLFAVRQQNLGRQVNTLQVAIDGCKQKAHSSATNCFLKANLLPLALHTIKTSNHFLLASAACCKGMNKLTMLCYWLVKQQSIGRVQLWCSKDFHFCKTCIKMLQSMHIINQTKNVVS